MEFVADRHRNPFDLTPPCKRFVPGYGPTDAHFHIVSDCPGVHGGLVDSVDLGTGAVETARPFFSYIHACAADSEPSADSYADLEPYFDAEPPAITAHVLLPVGERATRHVFEQYTALDASRASEMAELHATDRHGSGWLIVPIADPAGWTNGDERAVIECLYGLLGSDYRQIADLGRFLPDDDPHFVR